MSGSIGRDSALNPVAPGDLGDLTGVQTDGMKHNPGLRAVIIEYSELALLDRSSANMWRAVKNNTP